MTDRRVNCAVVGLGQGLEDVYVALQHPRMRLVAVCDPNERKYAWLTGREKLVQSTTEVAHSRMHATWFRAISELPGIHDVEYEPDYERLLRRDDVEAVILVVPDPLHESYTIAGLEAGKHVLCTKPMAATMQAALEVGRAARSHPSHYMLGLQMPYSPFARAVLAVVGEGLVGDVHQIRFDYHREPWRPAHSHRNNPVDGAIVKEGVHWLDMIYALSGRRPFRRISAFGAIDVLRGNTDFEDNGVLILDCDGFRAAHTFSYFRKSANTEDFLLVGDRESLRGSFSQLSLETDTDTRKVDISGFRYPLQYHVGYPEMHDEFAAAVLDGKEPYSNWETGLENMFTTHAAQVAVAENRTVTRSELREVDPRLALAQA